jgi:predicted ferric reductase
MSSFARQAPLPEGGQESLWAVRLYTALGCTAFTAALVVIRGGGRHRGFDVRGHEHRVVAAMNGWTAVSRSFGLAALVLVSATLPLGLAFGRRLVVVRRRAQIRAVHMTLSVCALAVITLHVATLMGATQLAPDVGRLLVPALWPYRRTATALGVVSVYVLLILGPTYFARPTLGHRRWQIAHRFIAVGLALAIVHVIGGG